MIAANDHFASPPVAVESRSSETAIASDNELVNILIVDDEPKNLTVLETVLKSPRYRIFRAKSAEQALLALLADEFAILILDVQMPGITGFELAQIIKERKKTAEIPIIFLTAYYNEDQHVIEGYDSGAVDYLHKPINPAILRSKVAVLAELHVKQRQLENATGVSRGSRRTSLNSRSASRTERYARAASSGENGSAQAGREQIRLLMTEVNHRSKNILSVVMAIAQQTVASSPKEFVQRFSSRVQALAVNHDLLVKNQWKSIEASDLVSGQLAHFGDLVGRRIILAGIPLRLSAAAAQSIGMVVHELSTNAVKHGALSSEHGGIKVTWQIEPGAAGERFTIMWAESGGPKVVAPSYRGFGTTVVTNMIE